MWRLLQLVFAVLFVFATAVQYNDPDPLRWMAIYGAAAAISGAAALRRVRWQVPAAVAVVALLWAATLVPAVARNPQSGGLFNEWGMASISVEEGREMYGLAIVAAWMSATAIHERRRR